MLPASAVPVTVSVVLLVKTGPVSVGLSGAVLSTTTVSAVTGDESAVPSLAVTVLDTTSPTLIIGSPVPGLRSVPVNPHFLAK